MQRKEQPNVEINARESEREREKDFTDVIDIERYIQALCKIICSYYIYFRNQNLNLTIRESCPKRVDGFVSIETLFAKINSVE